MSPSATCQVYRFTRPDGSSTQFVAEKFLPYSETSPVREKRSLEKAAFVDSICLTKRRRNEDPNVQCGHYCPETLARLAEERKRIEAVDYPDTDTSILPNETFASFASFVPDIPVFDFSSQDSIIIISDDDATIPLDIEFARDQPRSSTPVTPSELPLFNDSDSFDYMEVYGFHRTRPSLLRGLDDTTLPLII